MKSNFFSKIICLWILSFLFTGVTVHIQAQDQFEFRYESERKVREVQHGKAFQVRVLGVNQIDYEYKVTIEFVLPKPYTMGKGPRLPVDIKSAAADCTEECYEVFNDALKKRLTKFGQEEIKAWFINLQKMNCEECCKNIEDNDEKMKCIGKMKTFSSTIKKEIIDKNKREGAGYLIIKRDDIDAAMGKTKPGGALIITIEAKAKKWRIGSLKGEPKMISNGEVVDDIDKLELKDNEDKERVRKHMETQTIRINFSGPKGITFSMGPFISTLNRNSFGRIKNPNYEEGSTDAEKKDKYYIGFTEESDFVYGIAAYWNAPFGTIIRDTQWGFCWGVAYNLQDKIDKGISGLLGFYIKPKKSPGLINFGLAVGRIDALPDRYEVGKTAIGENEEIPIKGKISLGAFFSISFRF